MGPTTHPAPRRSALLVEEAPRAPRAGRSLPAAGVATTLLLSTLLSSTLLSSGVLAQDAAPPPEAAAEDAPVPVAPPAPFEADVDDPMLAPIAPPERVIATWQAARDLLLERSTDLRIALADVERAEGRWRQSLSELLPNAFAQAGVGYDLLNPTRPTLPFGFAPAGPGEAMTTPLAGASLSLTQSLVDVSAWNGLSSASALERSAEASLEDTRRRVSQGLAASAIAVVAAERAAELNRLGLRQALEREALTNRLLELGAATQLDEVRVRQDVAVARSALIEGDERLRATREAFGLALGVREEVGVAPGFSLDGMLSELRERCEALPSVDQRGDVVAAEEAANAARASRWQALTGYLPSIGVSTSTAAITTTPGPASVPAWSIGAVLSVPLWEGGFREGLVKERSAVAEQSEQVAEATRRGVFLEEARVGRLEGSSAELLETARSARELAVEVDRLTRRMFEIGRASSFDLVQSAQALRQAELNLALREYQHVQARMDAFLTRARCG